MRIIGRNNLYFPFIAPLQVGCRGFGKCAEEVDPNDTDDKGTPNRRR